MQPQRSLIYILAALITLPLFGTVAPATTIDIIQTFDFPGATATLPQKIEDQTDLIGTAIFSDGTVKAFIYKPLKHKFSPAFAPPFDTGHYTQGRGINFRRHACRRIPERKRWHLARLYDDPPQLYNTFSDPNRDSQPELQRRLQAIYPLRMIPQGNRVVLSFLLPLISPPP